MLTILTMLTLNITYNTYITYNTNSIVIQQLQLTVLRQN